MSVDFNTPETKKELKNIMKEIKRTFDNLYNFNQSSEKKKIRKLATS